jgi:hypothetical protein
MKYSGLVDFNAVLGWLQKQVYIFHRLGTMGAFGEYDDIFRLMDKYWQAMKLPNSEFYMATKFPCLPVLKTQPSFPTFLQCQLFHIPWAPARK